MSVKRLVVSVVGGTILVIGLLLLVLPGPAFIVIPLGLAVLATEYVWARRWLKRARNMANPRKAKRTTRVLRQAFDRGWARWRLRLRRWLPGREKRPASAAVPAPAGSVGPPPPAGPARADRAVAGPPPVPPEGSVPDLVNSPCRHASKGSVPDLVN